MKAKTKRRLKQLAALPFLAAAALLLAFYVCDWLFPFPQEKLRDFFREKSGCRVLDRNGAPLRTFNGADDSLLLWVDLDEISPEMRQATLAIEDSRFMQHQGVDPLALCRALWQNLRNLRRVSGASTLTMQLCKQIEPRPRTLRTKVIEAFRAIQLEQIHSKREIQEMYLNSVPYGGNLVGVEAASLRYFGKHASELNLSEAALLAGLPQSPSRLRPDKHPERAKTRRDQVLLKMYRTGYIWRGKLFVALSEPVTVRDDEAPFVAPHFCEWVERGRAGRCQLTTTLDVDLQTMAESKLRQHVDELKPSGIFSGAVVIIDNHESALRVMSGAPYFFDDEHAGQFNAALARRSPGSALKPFTYALAFEKGIATPGTTVFDLPMRYKDYTPGNFDGQFRGAVQADVALRDSLNIPAIQMLESIGVKPLYDLLGTLGMQFPQGPEHYGLALTMGGAEVRLVDLANAYACLARLGTYRPLRRFVSDSADSGVQVLDPGACYLLAESLVPDENAEHTMACKTGTSNGLRDAWAVAYNPRYTVAVWFGVEGKGANGLVGADVALPLAKQLLGVACGSSTMSWYEQPATIQRRRVCCVSGQLAGPKCQDTREDLYSTLCSDRATCSYHKNGGWPARYREWFNDVELTGAPVILSPTNGQQFIYLKDDRGRQKIQLKGTGIAPLYWFVNGVLQGQVPSGSTLWLPLQRGKLDISCVDSDGRSDKVEVHVR